MVERTTTDTPSHMPDQQGGRRQPEQLRDSANAIMQAPKPATANSRMRPALLQRTGAATATQTRPPRRARGCPSASGPGAGCRDERRGIDIAPPSSTENMSSAIAPSMIWLGEHEAQALAMLANTGPRCGPAPVRSHAQPPAAPAAAIARHPPRVRRSCRDADQHAAGRGPAPAPPGTPRCPC